MKIPPAKVVAWIKANFPDCKSRKDGQWYHINSPFLADTKWHFGIKSDGSLCHDWRSDEWSGPISPKTGKTNRSFLNFVKIYKNISFQEAVSEVLGVQVNLKDLFGHGDDEIPEVVEYSINLPGGVEELAGSNDRQAKLLIDWLKSRGYSLEDIAKNKLHYLGMDVYWLFFEYGDMVYYQSRNRFNKTFRFPDVDVRDVAGKIVGKTVGSKGDYLYGFDDCESHGSIAITEAIFGQYTLMEQTVASGGATLTQTQINKISLLAPTKGIILSPDNDEAGVQSIIDNYQKLKALKYPLYYSLPPKIKYEKDGKKKLTKDWNELVQYLKMSREEVCQIHSKNIKSLRSIGTVNEELIKLRLSL